MEGAAVCVCVCVWVSPCDGGLSYVTGNTQTHGEVILVLLPDTVLVYSMEQPIVLVRMFCWPTFQLVSFWKRSNKYELIWSCVCLSWGGLDIRWGFEPRLENRQASVEPCFLLCFFYFYYQTFFSFWWLGSFPGHNMGNICPWLCVCVTMCVDHNQDHAQSVLWQCAMMEYSHCVLLWAIMV